MFQLREEVKCHSVVDRKESRWQFDVKLQILFVCCGLNYFC